MPPVSSQLGGALQQLAAKFVELQGRIAQLERNQRVASLGNASIDNGSITFNDADGNPQIQLGLQPDGTFAHVAVNGTGPPDQPTDPVVAPGVEGLYVSWDGNMATGQPPFADFAGIQVHCSATQGFTPDETSLQGMMTTIGTFGVGALTPNQPYYVCLVSVSHAGLTGTPSSQVSGIPNDIPSAITPGSLSGLVIQTGTITAQQIADGAGILGSQLSSGTITSEQISAGTITASELAAGIIYGGIVDGTVLTGAEFVATGTAGQFLGYNGDPAAGNLVVSLSPVDYIDTYGNDAPPGLQVSAPGSGTSISLNPNLASPFNVTNAIAGVLEAVSQQSTDDPTQVIPGLLGSVILNTGSAAKMSTVLTSPVGTGPGAAILLEAQNDGGTDNPMVVLGTITTPDQATVIFTPIASFSAFSFILYGASSGQTTVSWTIGGSYTWRAPAGVTTIKAEGVGAGAGGQGGLNGQGTTNFPGPGGGGGEYSCEPGMAVTPLNTYSVNVGIQGTPGAAGGGFSSSGGWTTISGDAVTLTAHSGRAAKGSAFGPGGSGSTNTIHFDGGDSGPGSTSTNNSPNGSGGGGAASANGPGTNGQAGNRSTGGAGGQLGGAKGGYGGHGGFNAHWPGAGGGGGEGDSVNNVQTTGGGGADGLARISYSTGNPPVLVSISSLAGTDPFGTSFGAGFRIYNASFPPGTPGEPWQAGALASGLGGTLSYKLLPGGTDVRVNAAVTGLTSQLAAQNLWTPPSGYLPSSTRNCGPLEVNWNTGYAAGTILPPRLIVNTSGAAQVANIGQTTLYFDLTYPLDL